MSYEISNDTIFHGKIKINQPKRGYRFSIDSLLLPYFAKTIQSEYECGLEFGTGSGIISIILSAKNIVNNIDAIEIQPDLAKLAKDNIKLNSLEEKVNIIKTDFKTYKFTKKYDIIISNPPYRRYTEGNISNIEEKAIAKHEIAINMFKLVKIYLELLKPKKGIGILIYPVDRMGELFHNLIENKISPFKIRFVYAYPEGEGRFVIVAFRKNINSKLIVEPPLFIHIDKNRNETEETKKITSGEY